METTDIAVLKARIDRLETVQELMANALFRARWHLNNLADIEALLKRHSPRACADIVDAALDARRASSTFETALNTLRGCKFPDEPAHDM